MPAGASLILTEEHDASLEHMKKAARARRWLLNFMDFTWRTPMAPLIVGTHTEEIADRIDIALDDLKNGKSTYLEITVPFRHGKSDIDSRYLPPFALGRNPDLEIILATYGATLSEELSRDARAILQSEAYQELFPESKLDDSRAAVDSWGILGHKGKLRAVGLGGGVTGKGANVLIIDDYLKNRAEAESEVIRNKGWDAFTNDLMTRLAPVHIVIVQATRWHVDDIIGRIHEQMKDTVTYPNFPKFERLHFKARNDDGTYLFPERFGNEWYKSQFDTLGAHAAQALLQGEPRVRGGNMLKTERIQYVDSLPDGLLWVRFWDMASTEDERAKDSPDYSWGTKVAVQITNEVPTLYVADARWCQAEAPERDALIIKTAYEDGPGCWQGIEAVAGYKDAFTTIKKVLSGKSVVHGVTVNKDKVVRAGDVEPIFDAGNVIMLKAWWNEMVEKQLADFPAGVHDDGVDSLVGGYKLARQRYERDGAFGGRLGRGAVAA